MTSIRHSLAAQFFVAFALAAVLIIATLVGLTALSMRDGFSRYLLQAELSRLDDLVVALTDRHDPDAPNWPDLVAKTLLWHEILIKTTGPDDKGPPRRPALLAAPPGHPKPPPPGGDPFQFGDRTFLLGPDGEELIAPGTREPLSARRPIPAADPDAPVLGYVGLTAPRGARTMVGLVFLRSQYVTLGIAALFATALSALAAILMARQLLAPIRALEAGARTLADGDFEARIPNTRRDELGRLIDHTNSLAASLQAARDATQQLISDTSHELQTPLAVLRAEIEAMQDGLRQADDKTLEEMHDSIMRLSRLVADLKTLSFAREQRITTVRRQTDLAALLETRLTLVAQRMEEAGLRLSQDIDGPIPLTCDPERLGQVFDNLLSNALRYTTAPGELRVSAGIEDGRALVTFEDTPPAPPEESMAQLFERFYRADASRSRAHGGSGLGLAICHAMVDAHGGTIAADLSPLGGLRIRIALPLEGPENGRE
ncbi:ATP-binding protein [Tropicimonas sp. TH_r6]|uniref:ATP-binding protein n=1 Tax=Tropicimonas sp. TH_r6 TaxID=3082085 RepID=UPI0029532573|nr:ATP-binding protein [Tropicimonas sp. TH_r6]MDV7141849.1 ATP-binding protein [Tropicimonas sp. TH_r6]